MVQKIEQPSSKSEDPLDRLLDHFGLWQFLFIGSVCAFNFAPAWVQLAILFLTPRATFWCATGPDSSLIGENNTCYEDCVKYEYDVSPMESTIVSEWDLVCDRRWLASLTQTITQLGVLVGNVFFGFASDRFGRKNTFLVSTTMVIVLGFAVPFSPNITVFTSIRFFLGMATGGSMLISFVIVMESVSARYRGIVGSMYHIPHSFGHMSLSAFAFFFRSWDSYCLALAVPPLMYLGYFFLLTDTPRWLVSNGRVEEAAVVLKKAAKMNNLPTSHIDETLRAISADITPSPKDQSRNYLDLFNASLRVKTVFSCLIWLAVGVVYFGLNQYISQTSDNVFISVAAAGGIQVPSGLLMIWVTSRFGRKTTTATFLLLAGLSIIVLDTVPDIFWMKLTLGSLGVCFIYIAGSTVYIYTSELYPTVVRNMAMGAASTCMRVGSMVAPFVSNLTVSWLPTVILSVTPIIAGALCLYLPETKGKALTDTMEDSENVVTESTAQPQ